MRKISVAADALGGTPSRRATRWRGASPRPWLEAALRWQALTASAGVFAFAALAGCGVVFGVRLQIAIALAGVVFLGFPHGAFDHLVARPVLRPRLGQFWWAPFGVVYVGLAALVCAAWACAPDVTFALFLAGSVVHFGAGDTHGPRRTPGGHWLSIVVLGSLPILLPAAFYPVQTAPVFAAIAGTGTAAMAAILSRAMWFVPAWGAGFVWVCFTSRALVTVVIMRVVLILGFVLLPPVLAFGLYFGLVHAPRHLLDLGAWHDPENRRRATTWLAATIIPASFMCAVGIAFFVRFLQAAPLELLCNTIRLLAALTLPHMIVTAWLGARSDGFQETMIKPARGGWQS